MIRPAPFACDVCGKEKKETNHWFILLENYGVNTDAIYAVFAWDNQMALDKTAKHVCGSDCLAQMQSKLISKLQGVKNIFKESVDAEEVHSM